MDTSLPLLVIYKLMMMMRLIRSDDGGDNRCSVRIYCVGSHCIIGMTCFGIFVNTVYRLTSWSQLAIINDLSSLLGYYLGSLLSKQLRKYFGNPIRLNLYLQ